MPTTQQKPSIQVLAMEIDMAIQKAARHNEIEMQKFINNLSHRANFKHFSDFLDEQALLKEQKGQNEKQQ